MKRKILIISLVIALVLSFVAPSPVAAASGKEDKGGKCPQLQQFTATASIMVVDPGQSTQFGSYIFTTGEKIEGAFTAVDGWDELAGAAIQVTHASIIKLTPTSVYGGTYQGYARASIRVTLQSGDVLHGTYKATLQGEYSIMGSMLVINYVYDDGNFTIHGRSGRTTFNGKGDWAAALFLTDIGGGVYTLAGNAEVSGAYMESPPRR